MMKIASLLVLAPTALLAFVDEAQRAGRAMVVQEQLADAYAEALDRAEAAANRARALLAEVDAETSDIVASAYGFRTKKPTLRALGLRVIAQGGSATDPQPAARAFLDALQGLSDAGEILGRAAVGAASLEDPVALAAVSRRLLK